MKEHRSASIENLDTYRQKSAARLGDAGKIKSFGESGLLVLSFDFSDCFGDAGDNLVRVTL